MNLNEITCLSQLNLAFHCFEPEPISIPITPNESHELFMDEMQYSAMEERRDYRDELREMYED